MDILGFFKDNWKKLAFSAVVTVVAFFLFGWIIPMITSVKIFAATLAVWAGYFFYTHVAYWEIQKAAEKINVKI